MEQAQFGWTLVYGFRTYFMDSGWLRVLTITQTLKTFLWLYLYVVLEHGRLSHVLPIAVHLPTVHWTVREGHSNSLLLFQFLAAKAQLNTCTFLLSVCLSVRLKTEFLPVLSLLGPCLIAAVVHNAVHFAVHYDVQCTQCYTLCCTLWCIQCCTLCCTLWCCTLWCTPWCTLC